MTNNKEKFLKLVSGSDDSFLEMLKWNIDNEPWLKRSQAIAFRILTRLKELNISQKDLAERIGVSPQQVNKWVKGKENLSLETISKLELALDFELIMVKTKELSFNKNPLSNNNFEYTKAEHSASTNIIHLIVSQYNPEDEMRFA